MFWFLLGRTNMIPFLYRLIILPLTVMRNNLFLAVLWQGRKIPIVFFWQAWGCSLTVVAITNEKAIVCVNAHMFTVCNLKLNLKKTGCCWCNYLPRFELLLSLPNSVKDHLAHVDGWSFVCVNFISVFSWLRHCEVGQL